MREGFWSLVCALVTTVLAAVLLSQIEEGVYFGAVANVVLVLLLILSSFGIGYFRED